MADRWERHPADPGAFRAYGPAEALGRAEGWAKEAEGASTTEQRTANATLSVAWATIASVLAEVDR